MNIAEKKSLVDISGTESFELLQARIGISNRAQKGRCLVAVQDFKQGDLIVEAPAYELPKHDLLSVRQLDLYKYIFFDPSKYGGPRSDAEPYLVFGPLTFCNHSSSPNAFVQWQSQGSIVSVQLCASRRICENDEITMRYANIDQYSDVTSWEQ